MISTAKPAGDDARLGVHQDRVIEAEGGDCPYRKLGTL